MTQIKQISVITIQLTFYWLSTFITHPANKLALPSREGTLLFFHHQLLSSVCADLSNAGLYKLVHSTRLEYSVIGIVCFFPEFRTDFRL